MIYNQEVVRAKHPAADGYRLEFFIQGDVELGFQSGSGSFDAYLPDFKITGISIYGEEQARLPTGSGLQFSEDFTILENMIDIECFFSGDYEGSGVRNIRELDIYTGDSPAFSVDLIDKTNLITSTNVQIFEPPSADIRDRVSFTFPVAAEKIDNRTSENISYKVVAKDYLTHRNISLGVTSKMFAGFPENTIINTSEYRISRNSIRDIELTSSSQVDIFTGSNIIIDGDIILDFSARFRVRTSDPITISGDNGAILQSANTSFPVVNNALTIPGGNSLLVFSAATLLDINSRRESFIITI